MTVPSLFCCSFCGKSRTEVRGFIVGPCVNICDECVRMAAELIGEPELMAPFDARCSAGALVTAAGDVVAPDGGE